MASKTEFQMIAAECAKDELLARQSINRVGTMACVGGVVLSLTAVAQNVVSMAMGATPDQALLAGAGVALSAAGVGAITYAKKKLKGPAL